MPDDVDAHELLSLLRSAEVRLLEDPAYRAELARWTAGYPTGVTASCRTGSVSPPSVTRCDAQLRCRPTAASRHPERFEESPAIAVLSTSGDAREDWLRAVMAMERVPAHRGVGVYASFFTQALEITHPAV